MNQPLKAGAKTNNIPIVVTREEIRAYAKAIGEENIIFHQLDAAQNAGFADLVIPATYITVFWQHIDIQWLEKDDKTVIHTEQKFEYNKPLIANVTYDCQITLLSVRQRGNKQFLKHRLEVREHDHLLATSDTLLVVIDNK